MKSVKSLPHNPTSWKARRFILRKLHYPELATSDAYKSILLYNAAARNALAIKMSCFIWHSHLAEEN
jgi:hypothetical protein